jgi:CRP/FNR family cyclic AMP-dependent transcriptional regulator
LAEIPIADRIAVLEGNECWFGLAPKDFRDALLARCEWRTCAAGQPIYHAVDESADLMGIADGTVEFYSRFAAGDNPLLHLAHEGFWLGTGSVLSGGAPRVSVIARTDTLVARIPTRAVQALLESQPLWWRALGRSALEYGDLAISAYADLLVADTECRCARTLLRIGGLRYPRRTHTERRDVLLSQEELAALVNVSRTTLVQILRSLERRGLITQGYRSMRIVDLPRLQALAAGG